MRPNHPTLRAAAVHAYARDLLVAELQLRDYKRAVPARLFASLLLLAACWQTSLSGACALLRHAPCHEAARQALYACLPPRPRDLLDRLLAALRRGPPEHLGRVPRVVALDWHQRPYYGRARTKGCSRRQKKAGTRRCFTYATLAVLDGPERFTVGLVLVRATMRLLTTVERLLAQAAAAGLGVAYLMADKQFYAAEVVAWLQRRGVAFLLPARRTAGNGPFYAPTRPPGWYAYTWTTPLRRQDFRSGTRHKRGTQTVAVDVCVARHQSTGRPLVYVSWGLSRWPPACVVAAYRRRFGIEVSYRQLGQCLAVTSSRSERVRLLLVGVALLLCNLWAWLHSVAFGDGALGERRWRLGRLRLTALVRALTEYIAALLGGCVAEWPTQRPLPQCFMHDPAP